MLDTCCMQEMLLLQLFTFPFNCSVTYARMPSRRRGNVRERRVCIKIIAKATRAYQQSKCARCQQSTAAVNMCNDFSNALAIYIHMYTFM